MAAIACPKSAIVQISSYEINWKKIYIIARLLSHKQQKKTREQMPSQWNNFDSFCWNLGQPDASKPALKAVKIQSKPWAKIQFPSWSSNGGKILAKK